MTSSSSIAVPAVSSSSLSSGVVVVVVVHVFKERAWAHHPVTHSPPTCSKSGPGPTTQSLTRHPRIQRVSLGQPYKSAQKT